MNRKIEPYLPFSLRLLNSFFLKMAKPYEEKCGSNGKFRFPEASTAAVDLCTLM